MGPQCGNALSHGAEILFHLAFLDLVSLNCEFPAANAMYKKLEKGTGLQMFARLGSKPIPAQNPFQIAQ